MDFKTIQSLLTKTQTKFDIGDEKVLPRYTQKEHPSIKKTITVEGTHGQSAIFAFDENGNIIVFDVFV